MKFLKYYIIIVLSGLGLNSCFPESDFPVEPNIAFESFEADSSVGFLRIDFTDGDGDIGLNDSGDDLEAPYDTGSYFHHNMYIVYEEKDNQDGWEVGRDLTGDSIVFNYRINRIEKNTNGGLEGTIEVKIAPNYYNPTSSDSDTIRYRIQLIDRDLNKSPWVYSDPITR